MHRIFLRNLFVQIIFFIFMIVFFMILFFTFMILFIISCFIYYTRRISSSCTRRISSSCTWRISSSSTRRRSSSSTRRTSSSSTRRPSMFYMDHIWSMSTFWANKLSFLCFLFWPRGSIGLQWIANMRYLKYFSNSFFNIFYLT